MSQRGDPQELLAVLAKHADVEALLNDLQATDYARRSSVFLTLLFRLRKAAGLKPLSIDDGPKELLELIERLEAETEKETDDEGTVCGMSVEDGEPRQEEPVALLHEGEPDSLVEPAPRRHARGLSAPELPPD